MSTVRRVLVATSLPLALAMTPAARWGHQAVFVPSQQAMYVVGGEVAESGSQITNEVLVLSVRSQSILSCSIVDGYVQLNSTNPSFTAGPNDALPPHAFAAAALSRDGGSLMVIGGMTSQCASDSLTHTLDLSGSDSTWHHATPAQTIRKRGAAAAWVDDGSDDGKVMVIGGVADKFVCCMFRPRIINFLADVDSVKQLPPTPIPPQMSFPSQWAQTLSYQLATSPLSLPAPTSPYQNSL